MKKPITEMSIDDLKFALEIMVMKKNEFVRVQNYQSALIYRDKELKLRSELESRIEADYDI